MKVKIDEILRELETHWEAASLPGRQSCEHNAAWRELWKDLQRQPGAHEPVRLRVIRSAG